MLNRKQLINIISFPVFIKPWRRSFRSFLKKKLVTEKSIYREAFKKFKKSLIVYKKAPNSFSFEKTENPQVSIIIPVYNQYRYTHLCLWALLNNTTGISYEIILADDCSSDETRTITDRIKNIKVIRTKENVRFLKNCNNASQYAQGKYLLFLNNDTQVQPNWLKPLVDLMESDKNIGLVGSQFIYPDGLLQEAGGIIFQDASGMNYGHNDLPIKEEYNYVKEVDYISGASIMLRRELWEKLKGFDEKFVPAYYEDTDLSFRVRQQGLKVVYQPLSKIIHFEGKSNGTDIQSGQKQFQVVNQEKFYNKWKDVLLQQSENKNDLFLAKDRSLNKKTLLFIDLCILTYDQDTGSRSSFQYLKFFVDHGLNVKFLSLYKTPKDYHLEKIQQMGIEVVCLSDVSNIEYVQWLEKNGQYIDYVYLNRPNVAGCYFSNLRKYTRAKIIYQGHDLHFLRLKQQYDLTKDHKILSESKFFEKLEKELFPQMDVITFFSKEEINEIQKWGIEKPMDDVPLYLFDASKMDQYNYFAQKRQDILFVGGYRHQPNGDAAQFLIKEIMPLVWKKLPKLKVHLVGSHPPKELLDLASDRVIIDGCVSDEELEHLYTKIRLSVIPLRYGAGVKGKVLESVYHKVPVLTTPVGVQGISNTPCIHVQKTAEQLANQLIFLYEDEIMLNEMSKESFSFIKNNYSEHVIFEKFSKWIEIK